jgi:hypothetical protein
MSELAAHEILDRLFRIILAEAEQNPAFATRLLDALPEGAIAKLRSSERTPRKQPGAPDLHAINVLRTHGEHVLRGKLEQIRILEDLKSIARRSGLVLTGTAGRAKPSRTDLVDGIIAAAKHYDAQRSEAAAIAARPAIPAASES